MTDALADVRQIAAELRDVLVEIETISDRMRTVYRNDPETGEIIRILGSEGRHKEAYNRAYEYKNSQKNRGSEHDRKQYAELHSFDEWCELNADKVALRVAQERAHSLRQILSSYQTAARVEADLSR